MIDWNSVKEQWFKDSQMTREAYDNLLDIGEAAFQSAIRDDGEQEEEGL